ncbi:hypothetical protein [Rufibacter ruber]|uniref:hypothetical protein n=1 Tax=Rufibacter ruber TaxID=1783499 RepID=UPI0008328EA3|nr:hypothetical protein [Rufibacter ruber]
MTKILLVVFLTSALLNKNSPCNIQKVYGEWIFIKSYSGELSSIKGLGDNILKTKFGLITMTYSKDGQYTNDQGDYVTKGKFVIDKGKCLIKESEKSNSKSLKNNFKILHVDDKYLLIYNIGQDYTYFYKRK